MTNTTYCPVSRTLGRRPEQLLPAIPYLLGYHPSDSLVCLFFGSDGGMRLSSLPLAAVRYRFARRQ